MRAPVEHLPAFFLADEPRAVLDAIATVADASSGGVRRPDGMNTRTGKPEREGLFCARIFGPVDDLRCLCGKLDGPGHAGETCDRCGVLCGERALRDIRWGHVESPVPLVHPCLAPRIAAALGWRLADLQDVLHFKASLNPDGTLTRSDEVLGGRGPGAIARALGDRADALMTTRIPITPPGWRGTRRDPQDEAYAALINRCNRLARLIELDAPQIILDNEEHMAQQALGRLLKAVRAELLARRPVVVAPPSPDLLQAIYDDPDDDHARRAYAAHLRAAGDPRGEFIERQLAGAWRTRTPKLEADLLRRNLDRWLAPLADAVTPSVSFRRGFPSAATTTPAAAARVGDPAWSTFEHLDTDLLELITHPNTRGLKSLALPYRALRALCEGSVVLPRIAALTVRLGRCPPPDAELVTRGDALPGLRTLTLRTATRHDDDGAWLSGTAMARRLHHLRLQLSFDRIDTFSLRPWVELLTDHPDLLDLDLELGKQLLSVRVRRDDGLPAVRLSFGQSLVERLYLDEGELAASLGRVLTSLDPHVLGPFELRSRSWFGDALAELHRSLRAHYGVSARLPSLA